MLDLFRVCSICGEYVPDGEKMYNDPQTRAFICERCFKPLQPLNYGVAYIILNDPHCPICNAILLPSGKCPNRFEPDEDCEPLPF